MDRIIEKKAWYRNRKTVAMCCLLLAAVVFAIYRIEHTQSVRTVSRDQLALSAASHRPVIESISVRGSVQPLMSVFLDAVDGGQVAEIYVEEGSFVEQGQPIVLLQNTDLRLNVARNDTSITEQINNLSNIANSLEMTRINTQRELIDIEYRIMTLVRHNQQMASLVNDGLVSQEDLLSASEELEYYRRVRSNVEERQVLEDRIREERLGQIGIQMQKLEENMDVAQQSYNSLLVAAPITGQLTSLSAIIGENKLRGQRIGQIDSTERNKIVAQVDEFYLGRVALGQVASFSAGNTTHRATVSRIYPEVANNSFTVDFELEGQQPTVFRRGQAIQLSLTHDDGGAESLSIPVGEYVRQSGGNWVFVVQENGRRAVRRDIVTGRRNNQLIEIIDGLLPGEQVITSSYAEFMDVSQLDIRL